MIRTLIDAIAYIDDQDPQEIGWAYLLTFADRHQESGALHAAVDDGGGGVVSELRALIAAYGGPEDVADGDIRYCDDDAGSYRWTAE